MTSAHEHEGGAPAELTEPAPRGAPLLQVRDLEVSFRTPRQLVPAVRGVSFDVHAGECLAIVGESGSGKSATARALVGLAGPTATTAATELRLGDTDLATLTERQWRQIRGGEIGLVLQGALVALDPLRRVGQEIAEVLRTHATVPATQVRGRVQELLERVGVPEPALRAIQRPGELSGGLRQRALIASAIAAEPRLIIADEPTTALDVTVQAQILDLLGRLKADGTAVLLISHDLAAVAQLADRIAVMKDGRFVEVGATRPVLTVPSNPYTQVLLDAVPGRGHRPAASGRVPVTGGTAETGENPVVLSAHGLTKRFRRADGAGWHSALDDVSFELRSGQTLGIVGESGSGKTTLGRIALGLADPDEGTVELDGTQWSAESERRRRRRRGAIQMVYQDPLSSFDPRHTVGRLLGQAIQAGGDPIRRPVRIRTDELLEQVGLPSRLVSRRPHELSGGQQQRVAIARALATRPRVIVCDEAVSALDVSVAAQILALFARLQAEFGVAYLFITHHLGVVREVSHRLLVMKDGRPVETGPTEEVFDRPRHPYTQALLAAIPRTPAELPRPSFLRDSAPDQRQGVRP